MHWTLLRLRVDQLVPAKYAGDILRDLSKRVHLD